MLGGVMDLPGCEVVIKLWCVSVSCSHVCGAVLAASAPSFLRSTGGNARNQPPGPSCALLAPIWGTLMQCVHARVQVFGTAVSGTRNCPLNVVPMPLRQKRGRDTTRWAPLLRKDWGALHTPGAQHFAEVPPGSARP